MSSRLIDTPILRDYLRGDVRARGALKLVDHRSLSVVSWLALMAECPRTLLEDTKAFLRSFERLSVSEAIADEALRQVLRHPELTQDRALVWASAIVNQLPLLTCDLRGLPSGNPMILVAYSGCRGRAGPPRESGSR